MIVWFRALVGILVLVPWCIALLEVAGRSHARAVRAFNGTVRTNFSLTTCLIAVACVCLLVGGELAPIIAIMACVAVILFEAIKAFGARRLLRHALVWSTAILTAAAVLAFGPNDISTADAAAEAHYLFDALWLLLPIAMLTATLEGGPRTGRNAAAPLE